MTDKPSFFPLVEECFNQFDNTNIILERKKVYNPKGRVQTEDEACELDYKIKEYLMDNNHNFATIAGDSDAIPKIAKKVMGLL